MFNLFFIDAFLCAGLNVLPLVNITSYSKVIRRGLLIYNGSMLIIDKISAITFNPGLGRVLYSYSKTNILSVFLWTKTVPEKVFL